MTFTAIWYEFWHNMLSFFYTYSHVNYIVWTAHNPSSCFLKKPLRTWVGIEKVQMGEKMRVPKPDLLN